MTVALRHNDKYITRSFTLNVVKTWVTKVGHEIRVYFQLAGSFSLLHMYLTTKHRQCRRTGTIFLNRVIKNKKIKFYHVT